MFECTICGKKEEHPDYKGCRCGSYIFQYLIDDVKVES